MITNDLKIAIAIKFIKINTFKFRSKRINEFENHSIDDK